LSALSLKVDLKPLNSFSVNATAEALLRLSCVEDWHRYQSQIQQYEQRMVLAGGSNVLFVDDYHGLIIKPEIFGIELLSEDSESVYVRVGAAENWHAFVLRCIEQGWYGLENLSLIPGTVGAAPVQNIGAYGVEVSECIESVRLLDLSSGEVVNWQRDACQFGYRDSRIKRAGQGKYLVLDVTFCLRKCFTPVLTYGPLKNWFDKQAQDITAKMISDAVCQIRNSKIPLPDKIPNAGSFFKNPMISHQQFVELKRRYPNIVAYPQGEQVKLAAGWLIEQTGLKGKRFAEVGVHSEQALVLVNYGGASGRDVLNLAQRVQQAVAEQFAVTLEPEVRIVGQS